MESLLLLILVYKNMLSNQFAHYIYIYISNFNVEINLYCILDYMMGF